MESIIDEKQECCIFQTQFDISNNKLTELKRLIENETRYSVLMNGCFNEVIEKEWDSEQAASEIVTQVVHMLKSVTKADDNLSTGDEITDIVTNILLLAYFEGISFSDIALYAKNNSSKIIDLLFLSSEILEETRRVAGHKINDREIEESKQIIKDKLSNMLIIVFNYAKEYDFNLQENFKNMHQDSTLFLKKRLEKKYNGC